MKRKLKIFINYIFQQYYRHKSVKTFDGNLEGEDLFFLTGYDKSGTTWIKKAINEVENYSCIGSNQYFDFFEGYPESSILKKIKQTRERSSVFNISANEYELFFKKAYLNRIKNFSKNDSKIYGEKSTVQDLELIKYYFPSSKSIVLVRDMRDIIVSFAFHFDRRNKKINKWTQSKSKFNTDGTIKDDFIEREISKLLLYFSHIIQFKQKASVNDIQIVRYEDLISSKGFIFFCNILNFLNKDNFNPSKSKRAWENNSFERLSEGRKPGQKNENSFFRSGTSNDYLNHLTKKQINHIEKALEKPLHFFNYI